MDPDFRVELVCNLVPVLGAFLSDDLEEFLIFSLLPLGFADVRFVPRIPFVLALGIIPPRNQVCNVLPVRVSEDAGGDVSFLAISMYCPFQQLRFLFIPITLCGILSKKYIN